MDTERLVSFPFGMASWQVGAVSFMEDTVTYVSLRFLLREFVWPSYFRKVGSFTLRHKGSLKQPNNDPTNQDLILHTFLFLRGYFRNFYHGESSPSFTTTWEKIFGTFSTTLGKSKHITGLIKPNSTLVSATFEADDFVGKKRRPSKIVSLKRPLWKYGTSHGKILKGKDESPVHFGYFHRSLSTAISQSQCFMLPDDRFEIWSPKFNVQCRFFLNTLMRDVPLREQQRVHTLVHNKLQ